MAFNSSSGPPAWENVGLKTQVNWLKMKQLQFAKKSPGRIQFKYRHDEPSKALAVGAVTPGRPATTFGDPVPAYKAQIQLTKAKTDDMMKLCQNKITPEVYRQWYKSLPSSSCHQSDAIEVLSDYKSDS